MSKIERQKEKDYEELFGDGSAELSDVADYLSDFEDYSDVEEPVTNQKLKKKPQTYRDTRSPTPVSPHRHDERSTPEGDRDEDEVYIPQPIRKKPRKPTERKKKLRRKKGRDEIREGDEDEDAIRDELPEKLTPLMESKMIVEKLFDEFLPKKKGRSKAKGIDLEKEHDVTAERLYRKMVKLADDDVTSCQKKEPASKKLDNLDSIVRELSKTYMVDALLENNILDAIRYWLEPLPDRSLPSITLQEQLLCVLDKYPINLDNLLSSKIGRIVFFYQESPRSTEHIKRLATNLVNKWGQPILGISVNYKDRQLRRVEYDPELIKPPTHNIMDAAEDHQPLQSTSSLVHARIPPPASFDYDVLPQSRIQIARSKKTDDPYRHLKQTMARMRRTRK